MKTIKIKFLGFWKEFDPEEYPFYQAMKKYYRVEITEDADYIICSMLGSQQYDYCAYPQVRIMFTGENYIPDFNLIDYAISPYPITFLDRAFYLPNCIDKYHHCEELMTRDRNYSAETLKNKTRFANFIASHDSENNIRGDFFKKLCEYKRVESVGTYLNNMPDGKTVDFTDSSKTEYQRTCKFSLCFESTKHEGFVTEKLTDAFYADTIPVYYGSSTVSEMFNTKAFINCADYPSWDAVMERIIELDQDDEKYLEMLRQPVFAEGFDPTEFLKAQEAFVQHIFDQPIEQAYRRSRVYWPQHFNNYLQEAKRPKDLKAPELCKLLFRRGGKWVKKLGRRIFQHH